MKQKKKYVIAICAVMMLTLCIMTNAVSQQQKSGAENESVVVPPDSVALENDYVRVMRNSATCTMAHTTGYGTRVIVALAHLTVRSNRDTVGLERGGVLVFNSDDSYARPTGEYFEVAFKLKHPSLIAPEQWIEPAKNIAVFEDEYIRVFEERLAPGDERPLHSHAQRIVIRFNEVQLTDPRLYPVPKPGTGIQVPNTVRFAQPIVHVVRNCSTTTALFNIVIEYKLPK